MRRVPEVLDCWFESGSMPFAQVHYPFENAGVVRAPLPGRLHRRVHRADARLVLHACTCWPRRCSTGRRSGPASATASCSATTARRCRRACATTRTRYEMFDTYGADAMRWFLMSSPVLRGGDLPVTEPGSATRCARCCCRCGTPGTSSRSTPTRTGVRGDEPAPTRRTCSTGTCWPRRASWSPPCTAQMDAYDLFGACGAVRSYLDALTNWYIRRSRDRFWSGDQDAFDTLYTVLGDVPGGGAAAAADRRGDLPRPHRRAQRAPDRLAPPRRLPADPDLVAAMDAVREVCSAALSLRKANGPAGAAPAALADRGRRRRRGAGTVRRADRRRGQRQGGRLTDDVGSVPRAVLQVVPAVARPRLGPRCSR